MTLGSGLARLGGFPFEVRYSEGSMTRARATAEIAADAYRYLTNLFDDVTPDIALIVADRNDWESRQPYGLPFFDDEDSQIRPGIVVVPAGRGDFWFAMGEKLRVTAPNDYEELLSTYPDGQGGLDLQPFFDLIAVHELGHAFEVFGDLRFPTFWLGEIFANLCLHAYVVTRRAESLKILESLPTVGARSTQLYEQIRVDGYSTLEQLEDHYTGGDDPMNPLNYVWYQYRWQRLASEIFDADGEDALRRFGYVFRKKKRDFAGTSTAVSLAPMLSAEISETLGRAVQLWP